MYHRWNLMYTAGSALLVASIPDKPALNTNEDEEAGELAKMKKMPSGLSKPSESSHSELSIPVRWCAPEVQTYIPSLVSISLTFCVYLHFFWHHFEEEIPIKLNFQNEIERNQV